MRLLLEDIESNANIAEAFDDILQHMSADERRQDIPNKLGETLQGIARIQNDWQYIEAIRKCLPFLTKNISKTMISDIVDHMAVKGHILLHEQQYIHETTRISEKHTILFGYIMETTRDNKGAFTDLIEKLSEDKLREDIPNKLREMLDTIQKTSVEHEETVYRTLKRLDILYIPDEKGNARIIKETAQHSSDSNLFDAAVRSDYETFERLLQDNEDPDAINTKNKNGETPLIVSCKYADANFVQKLIENDATDVNIQDKKGRTAFFYAIMRRDKQLVSLLINCTQVDINTRDNCGLTFIWCIFGEDLANDLASTVERMYMNYEKMTETFINIIREKHTYLNWEEIMDIVQILVANEKVNAIELLKTMILASHVPTVSYILQYVDIHSDHGDIIYDIILNAISANNVDIFRLLLECPHINLGLLNIWSVNALLKYTLTSHSSRSIKALILKHSRGIRVAPALKTSLSLLCMDDEAIPLPEILEGYDMTRLNVSDVEDNTVFMILCQYGSEGLVSELLTHPEINFMAQNKDHQTAFMVALKSRSEEVACLLLQHLPSNVDPNKYDIDGMDGLLLACENKCDVIVHTLVARKEVNVNVTGGCRKQTALMEASFGGRDNVVSMLFGRKELDINVTDKYGQTALTLASEGGHDKVVAMLLVREANVNVIGGRLKQSALVRASKGGYGKVVSLLLGREGVNVNSADVRDYTALMLASFGGHGNVVTLLLERKDLDINVTRSNGQTALLLAASNGYDNVVSLLLGRNELRINAADKEGHTALILASERGHDTVVATLLARKDLSINRYDCCGRTALLLASWGGHDNVVAMLLGRKELDINRTDAIRRPTLGWASGGGVYDKDMNMTGWSTGQSALMSASRGGYDTIVSMLLGREDVDINIADEKGRTALMLASEYGHERVVSMLLGRKEVDVNSTGTWKHIALMLASGGGYDKVVAVLLDRDDVNVNAVDIFERTALMLASGSGYDKVVAVLLDRDDVNVNAVDIFERTALMWASMGGHGTTVAMLLDISDVNINLVDKSGQTAMMFASRGGHAEVVVMLLARDDVDSNSAHNDSSTAV